MFSTALFALVSEFVSPANQKTCGIDIMMTHDTASPRHCVHLGGGENLAAVSVSRDFFCKFSRSVVFSVITCLYIGAETGGQNRQLGTSAVIGYAE